MASLVPQFVTGTIGGEWDVYIFPKEGILATEWVPGLACLGRSPKEKNFETEFLSVVLAGLELTEIWLPLPPSAEINCMYHHCMKTCLESTAAIL